MRLFVVNLKVQCQLHAVFEIFHTAHRLQLSLVITAMNKEVLNVKHVFSMAVTKWKLRM